MRRRFIQTVSSKLTKTRALVRSRQVKRYIPLTKTYNRASLRSMLNTYKMVFVKPDTGSGGHGVIKVLQQGNVYKYQLQTANRRFLTFQQMADSIAKHTSRRKYLVQQGVHLLRYKNRPFDLRIMVQLNAKKRWETTGIVGRCANDRKIVTNICQGGDPVPVHTMLNGYFKNPAQKILFIRSLRRIGTLIAGHLSRTYPRLIEIGVDVGIDNRKKPWIIEVNTRPAIYGFRMLKDKRIYLKILRYSRSNGLRLKKIYSRKNKKA